MRRLIVRWKRDGQTCADVWQEELEVGGALSILPLCLRGEICLPVDLAVTYERTCRDRRIVSA